MADVVGTLRVVLQADATAFENAMKEASADVKKLSETFGKQLEPRVSAVNQAMRNFLGGPEIRRAKEYAQAVQQIGGVTKLVASDQQKVNAAMREALTHYTALGQKAPQSLVAIEQATRAAVKPASMLDSIVGMIGPRIMAAFSVGAVVGFAKSMVSAAGRVADLSEKMVVSAETTQQWEAHFKKTGVTIEQVSDSVTFMQRTIAKGSDETKAALQAAGLEFQTIRAMAPREMFESIAEGVRSIQDPAEQVRVGTLLLGRAFDEMLPGIRDGVMKARDEFAVMSDEAVDLFDAIGDAMEKFGPRFKAQIMNNIVGPLREWHDWQNRLNPGKGVDASKIPSAGVFAGGVPSMLPDKDQTEKLAKAQDELNKKTEKGIEKAEAYGEELADLMLVSRKLQAEVKKNADGLRMFGGEFKLSTIDLMALVDRLDELQRKGAVLTPELQAIRDKFMVFRDMVKDTRVELELMKQAMGSLAMMQFLGSGPLAQQRDTAEKRAFFSDMAAKGPLPGTTGVSLDQMNAVKQIVKPTEDWRKSLDGVVDAFEDLANISGDTMSDIARGIGSGLSATQLFEQGWKNLSKPQTFAGFLTGLSSVIGGLSQAIALGRALHDAMTRSEGEKAASDIRRGGFDPDLAGIGEDDALAQNIAQMVDDLGIDRNLAIDLNIADIIERAGGIDAGNFEKFRDRVDELFDDVKLGGDVGRLAVEELDRAMGQLGKHVVEQGGLWDQHFVHMLGRAREEGLKLASVMELVKGQLDIAASGLNQSTGNVETQESFDRLSRIALATFNAMIANGQSAAQAIAAIKPSIDALKDSAAQFGLAGNDAFNQLSRWSDLVSANQPLLDQVAGLNNVMTALANVGALDAQTFKDIQAQGLSTFKSLTDAGFTQQQALMQMKPMLETIKRLHVERGMAIDDETQKLIDQAEEQGILAAEQEDTNDVLKQGLGEIIRLLGGEIPNAWKKAADAAKQSMGDVDKESQGLARRLQDRLGDLDFTVDVGYNIDNPDIPGFAAGGRVDKPTLAWVGEEGPEWIIPEELIRSFSSGPSLPSSSMVGSLGAVDAGARVSGEQRTTMLVDGRVLGEIVGPAQYEATRRVGVARV